MEEEFRVEQLAAIKIKREYYSLLIQKEKENGLVKRESRRSKVYTRLAKVLVVLTLFAWLVQVYLSPVLLQPQRPGEKKREEAPLPESENKTTGTMAWLFENRVFTTVSDHFSNLWENSGSYVTLVMSSSHTLLFGLYLVLILVTIIALRLLQIPTEIVFIGLILIFTYFHRIGFYLLLTFVAGELVLLYLLLHFTDTLLNSSRLLDLLTLSVYGLACLTGWCVGSIS